MSYEITHFDSIALPIYNASQQRGTPDVESALKRYTGGVADLWGDNQKLPDVGQIQLAGIYLGEPGAIVTQAGAYLATSTGDHISAGSASNRLRSQLDDLSAMQGKRGQLWRRLADNGQRQWKYARLLKFAHDSKVDERLIRAECKLLFETYQPGWNNATATTATGAAGGPLLVSIGGNMPVRDATLAITASATITAITVAAPGCALAWSGTLSAGQKLTIDAGARTVRIGSATNAYSGFSIATGHTSQRWLDLAPGISGIIVRANAAATVLATWYDQWL
jgi:hypothetical protein